MPPEEPKPTRKNEGQLTAIIGFLIVIIGIPAAIVFCLQILFALNAPHPNRILADFGVIRTAMIAFEAEYGRFPTEAEGQKALVERPSTIPEGLWKQQLDEVLLDRWGNEYRFRTDITTNRSDFGFYSLGPDGKSNSRGNDDDDISTWRPTSLQSQSKRFWSNMFEAISTPQGLFLGLCIVLTAVHCLRRRFRTKQTM